MYRAARRENENWGIAGAAANNEMQVNSVHSSPFQSFLFYHFFIPNETGLSCPTFKMETSHEEENPPTSVRGNYIHLLKISLLLNFFRNIPLLRLVGDP